MKTSKKIIYCFMAVAVISGVFFLNANAQEVTLTDQQVQLVRNECVSTKNTLNQLHSSDALLRVNRGQIYESMLTKLMEKFNGRVTNNSLNSTTLVNVSKSYSQILDTFRLDYKSYETQLTLAIDIDCSKQPVAFYNAIASARSKRSIVHNDVVSLNQFIDQYESAVIQFENDYQVAAKGSK